MEDGEIIEFYTAGCKTLADDTLRIQVDINPHNARQAFALFGERGTHGGMVRIMENE